MQKGIGASDPNIHLELVGTKAMSGPVKVKTGWLGALRRPHRRQVCDDLIVESREDLGDILVVVLDNNNGWFTNHGTPWYVKYVAVYSDNKEVMFPCYHWIGEEHIHFTAHTSKSLSSIGLLFLHLNSHLGISPCVCSRAFGRGNSHSKSEILEHTSCNVFCIMVQI